MKTQVTTRKRSETEAIYLRRKTILEKHLAQLEASCLAKGIDCVYSIPNTCKICGMNYWSLY